MVAHSGLELPFAPQALLLFPEEVSFHSWLSLTIAKEFDLVKKYPLPQSPHDHRLDIQVMRNYCPALLDPVSSVDFLGVAHIDQGSVPRGAQ